MADGDSREESPDDTIVTVTVLEYVEVGLADELLFAGP
jgi:hypothetical protein